MGVENGFEDFFDKITEEVGEYEGRGETKADEWDDTLETLRHFWEWKT